MNSKPSPKMLALVIIFGFITLTFCDSQSISDELDKKTAAKSEDAVQKTQLLQALGTEGDSLKQAYASVLQSNLGVLNSYRAYYAENARCEGLSLTNDLAGLFPSVPDDFCLVAPIALEAIEAYTITEQQDILLWEMDFAEKVVEEQIAFNADVYNEFAFYTKIR